MALEGINGTIIDTGTGAVKMDESPTTYEQTPGHPVGTGAVASPDKPVTYEFGPTGQDPTGAVEITGPVTYEGPFGKLIKAPAREQAQAQTTAETDQPAQGRRRADTGAIPTQQNPSDGR